MRRVCDACDVRAAVERRARFGRARGELAARAQRAGCYIRVRRGGAFCDRMLTLTVPHLDAGDLPSTVRARVGWLFDAWTRFRRELVQLLRATHGHAWEWVHLHRAFEWTPGDDGGGHPHFHVWLHSQWISRDAVADAWTRALRAAGCPLKADARAVVHLKRFVSIDWRAVRELHKGGRTGRAAALKLSGGAVPPRNGAPSAGRDAFEYADGWTLGDVAREVDADVLAALYEALEGRHLSHASRGLFVADPPCACEECAGVSWRTLVTWDEKEANKWSQEKGAGPWWNDLQARTTGPPELNCPALTLRSVEPVNWFA